MSVDRDSSKGRPHVTKTKFHRTLLVGGLLGACLAAAPDRAASAAPAPGKGRPTARSIATAVPPTAQDFGWQTLQTAFRDAQGQACTGAVTLATSDHAVCYV